MDKDPTNRPSMSNFEKVMENFAKEVEEATAEQAEQELADSDEDCDIGLDLDDDDEDYEDNELF